jgi:hypothetical protein
MKTNKSLFEKQIDLKSCQINGGRLAESHKETTTATRSDKCSDTQTVISNDCGEPIQACTDYVCN